MQFGRRGKRVVIEVHRAGFELDDSRPKRPGVDASRPGICPAMGEREDGLLISEVNGWTLANPLEGTKQSQRESVKETDQLLGDGEPVWLDRITFPGVALGKSPNVFAHTTG